MTIEIKQLIIRASAEPRREAAAAAPARGRSDKREDSAAIIDACVRQVLRELERLSER